MELNEDFVKKQQEFSEKLRGVDLSDLLQEFTFTDWQERQANQLCQWLREMMESVEKADCDQDKKDEFLNQIHVLFDGINHNLGPHWAALHTLYICGTFWNLSPEVGRQYFAKQATDKARNARWTTERQELIQLAVLTINKALDEDKHPEWKHNDFVAWVLRDFPEIEEFKATKQLKSRVVDLFEKRGLHNRIIGK